MLPKQALGTRMAGLWVLLLLSAMLLSISTFLLVTAPSAHAQEDTAAALPAGDPAVGRELFTGAQRFENGGPPCMGCHPIGGIGALGGGSLGPDLTQSATQYGGAANMTKVLSDIPFPTMMPIFGQEQGRTPLTDQEAADLAAFMQQASTAERSTGSVGILLGLSLTVAAVFVVLGHLVWRNRAETIRKAMVEERYQWTPWNPGGGPGH